MSLQNSDNVLTIRCLGRKAVPAGHFYEFSGFRLDPDQRLLFRDDAVIPLTPKAFETLLLLVENRGRIVEKETLLKAVWPDTFVEEGSLTRNISVLRKALENGEEGQSCIETIPKRGYRFVASVRLVESAPQKPRAAKTTEVPWFGRRHVRLAAVVPAIFLVAVGFYVLPRIDRPRRRAMLAVLPVQNLTGNNDRIYLADGLTEEIISQLGATDPARLGVIARTSSMAYKNSTKTVDEIGRGLKADYVLEASLRESGNRIRVTAQLIEVGEQARMWSENYDAPPGDTVMIEDQIARAIASQIHLELQPSVRQRLARQRSLNPQSHDLYLQARYYWNMRTRDGLGKGLSLFYQAAEKDPANARAFAGMADSYNMMMFYGYSPGAGTLLKAKAAAQKAIELDESLAEGHAALAYMDFMWMWEWPKAEQEFRRAIELNPNYVPAHHWFALFLSAMGRHEEALAQIKEARVLDPLSLIVRAAAGLTEYYARKYDDAITECKSAIGVNPEFVQAHTVLGHAYLEKRMLDEAIAEYQKALSLTPGPPFYLSDLGYAYGVSGRTADAKAILATLRDLRRRMPYVSFTADALVYAGMGNKEDAVQHLLKASDQNDAPLLWLRSDPRWDEVRRDPRLISLLPPAPVAQGH